MKLFELNVSSRSIGWNGNYIMNTETKEVNEISRLKVAVELRELKLREFERRVKIGAFRVKY